MKLPIVSLRHVTKIFGNHVVLEDINLDIYQGEIFGIIGVSGSGKTTLLNTIIGFYKPDEGEVLFRVKPIISNEEIEMRAVHKNQNLFKRMYGFAPQYHSFYDKLTVKENLEYFGTIYGLDKQVIEANIKSLLKFMNLEDFKDRISENLSGGMKRRLDIACSLIHEPEILLLDEPTADLDPILSNHILKLLKKINKKGTTIIMASHHLEEVEDICDRVAIIKDGKILAVGSPEEIKKKVVRGKEIIIETQRAKYSKLIQTFKKDIIEYETEGPKIIIRTHKHSSLLKKVLSYLERKNEVVIDLEVREPTIKDVFFRLMAESAESEKNGSNKENNK